MAKTSRVAAKPVARQKMRVPSIVPDALRSPGRPLAPVTRSRLEQRFGFNFAKVRIHEGDLANRSAKAVDSVAYTVGEHIVVAQNASAEGLLLAHELAHVVQNGGRQTDDYSSLTISPDGDSFETHADCAADAVASARAVAPQPYSPSGFLRRRAAKKPEPAAPKVPSEEEKERAEQEPLLSEAVDKVYLNDSAEPLLETLDLTDEAAVLFQSRYHTELVPWLIARMKDRSKLVRSVAIVIDGLDWPLHAVLASATLGLKELEAPPLLLERIQKLEARQRIKLEYQNTYVRPGLSRAALEADLLAYYGQLNKPDYQKAIALLDHDLTDAERLFFLRAGRSMPEVPKIVSLINDLWKSGGATALSELDADWSRYVQNRGRWWPKGDGWSEHNLYEALQDSLQFQVAGLDVMSEWGTIEPLLRAMKSFRKEGVAKYGYESLDREIDAKINPVLEVMDGARNHIVNDRDTMHQALMTFHQIWRSLIAKAKPGSEREHVLACYHAKTTWVQYRYFSDYFDDRTTAPLFVESPTLADEFYSLLYPGFTSRSLLTRFAAVKDFAAIQTLLLKAWAEGGKRIDEMIDDAMHEKRVNLVVVRPMFSPVAVTRGISFFPGAGLPEVTDVKRKRVMTLVEDVANALRGMHCLQVELNPNLELSEALKNRPSAVLNIADTDLEAVHKLLTTSGISSALRNEVIRNFIEKTRAGDGPHDVLVDGRRSETRTFLSYLSWLTDGDRGDWFYRIQTLIDPTLDVKERLTRMELRTKSGSNWFSAGLADTISEVNRQDPREAVNASMSSVRATGRVRQSRRVMALYGAKSLEDLAGVQDSEFESRVTALHASEEAVNAMVQKAVEWVVEGALCAALGPAWWAQLIAAVGSKMAGMTGREVLSGSRFKLESRENVKDLIMTAVGSLLVDPVNIRGRLGEIWKPEQARMFSRMKPANADFVGQIMLNGVTGAVEAVLTEIPGIALDVILLNQDFDMAAMASAANIALSQIAGKSAMPFFGSTKINPQAIHDLTSASDNFKINILFKMMLAVPSAMKKIGEDSAKDDYFDMGDLLNSAGASFGQKMGGALFKGSGSAIARIRAGRKNVAQVAAVHGPAGHLTEEAYRVIGEASRVNPKIAGDLLNIKSDPVGVKFPKNATYGPMRFRDAIFATLPDSLNIDNIDHGPKVAKPREVRPLRAEFGRVTTTPLQIKRFPGDGLQAVRLGPGKVLVHPDNLARTFSDPAHQVVGPRAPLWVRKPIRVVGSLTDTGASEREISVAVGMRRVAEARVQMSGKDTLAIHKILLEHTRKWQGETAGSVFGGNKGIPFRMEEAGVRAAAEMAGGHYRASYREFHAKHADATPQSWVREQSRSNPDFSQIYQEQANSAFRIENRRRKIRFY
jgi:hypothetical protein